MVYINGGKLPGMTKESDPFDGADDQTPPRSNHTLSLAAGLFFARESSTWTRGVAFIDSTASTDGHEARVALRGYNLSLAQFQHILQQENGKIPLQVTQAMLEGLVEQGVRTHLRADEVSRDTVVRVGARHRFDTPSWYNTMLVLDTAIDGAPIVTFTCAEDVLWRELQPPSDAYLRVLFLGLQEAGLTADEAARYLAMYVHTSSSHVLEVCADCHPPVARHLEVVAASSEPAASGIEAAVADPGSVDSCHHCDKVAAVKRLPTRT